MVSLGGEKVVTVSGYWLKLLIATFKRLIKLANRLHWLAII
jgi:hypothetical protein